MKTFLFKTLRYGLAVGCLGFSFSACQTTKMSMENLEKLLSSTSHRSLFTPDGLVEESQKVNLYMAVVFENLQQDMARGNGEHLPALAALLGVPAEQQPGFFARAQERYQPLMQAGATSPDALLTALHETMAAYPVLATVSMNR
jgi:hypothetical protein